MPNPLVPGSVKGDERRHHRSLRDNDRPAHRHRSCAGIGLREAAQPRHGGGRGGGMVAYEFSTLSDKHAEWNKVCRLENSAKFGDLGNLKMHCMYPDCF